MKKFISKVALFSCIVFAIVGNINFLVDPAYICHDSIVENMVEKLSVGKIIESPGDVDEGLFQKEMISSLKEPPQTVIIGSSHIMYEPWDEEFDNYYVAGVSGAYLGDYYALCGILEYYDKMPERIVIGVDPWAFMTDAFSGRHTSIAQFSEYEMSLINGETIVIHDVSRNSLSIDKIKEMFSFSYFQSSVKLLWDNGLARYLHRESQEIVVFDNDDVGESGKILPSGRRTFASKQMRTAEKNIEEAESAVSVGSIYQLGTGFSDIQTEQLNQFEKLIVYLQNQGVEISFYMHPWHSVTYDCFQKNEEFGGVIKTEDYLRELAESYGIVVHGTYNPYLANISDDDWADWFHLKSEKMMESYYIVLE